MVYMFCNDHSFYMSNRNMENVSSTQVAMSDISSLKSQLGLDHEALRIDKDNFDTTFVGVKYLNTKENRRLNKLAIAVYEIYHAEHIEWG